VILYQQKDQKIYDEEVASSYLFVILVIGCFQEQIALYVLLLFYLKMSLKVVEILY